MIGAWDDADQVRELVIADLASFVEGFGNVRQFIRVVRVWLASNFTQAAQQELLGVCVAWRTDHAPRWLAEFEDVGLEIFSELFGVGEFHVFTVEKKAQECI